MNVSLQLWGGLECTVNRVGDGWRDQLVLTGSDARGDDYERLTRLGVAAIRYPVLWENDDWSRPDRDLPKLRALGVRPIVGLVHHGSGPASTSLIDSSFATGLAAHAKAVIQRYPWLDAFTPVNEPLTTARFSGLYGFWYPHCQSDHDFVRCLYNQCRAVTLAMQEIREVNPRAILVQTEDLGQTHGSPRGQVRFENRRRWLTWDLLSGHVDSKHRLWKYLRRAGLSRTELHWLVQNPCPPDIIGVNHYLTSERHLDEDWRRHDPRVVGGNRWQRYADVEAVRMDTASGLASLLKQVWQRYLTPIAITECHLGCTREEQLRWLEHVWNAAQEVRADGVDLRAVTAWSAFGAVDWNSLLTRSDGHYESGLFDIRSVPPRETALAAWVRQRCAGQAVQHPVLNTPGWWERPERLLFATPRLTPPAALPIMIVGVGTLGRAMAQVCASRGLPAVLLNRQSVDIADTESVREAIRVHKPWAVINAAGYRWIDAAEVEPARCRRENTTGAIVLADACAAAGLPLVTFSSDYVFDGSTTRPYCEIDGVAPLNVYGASKAEADAGVRQRHPDALIVRCGAFLSADADNVLAGMAQRLRTNETLLVPSDLFLSPVPVVDLCHTVLDLLVDDETGLWHVVGPDVLTWCDLAQAVAERLGSASRLIQTQPAARFGWAARRPSFSALTSRRGVLLPSLSSSLDGLIRTLAA